MFTSKLRAAALFAIMSATGCTHLFYHPSDLLYVQNPADLDQIREEVSFKSVDGTRLAGWFMRSRHGKHRGIVVQFHGNAENLTSHFRSVFWLVDEGYDVFTFDYRGYGISEGKPDEKGTVEDALAAMRYALHRETPPGSAEPDVVLYGQSLGGAILMRAFDDVSPEERRRVRALIIESSFYNYHAIARDVLSRSFITFLFQPLAYLLVSNAYGPEEAIPRIAPTPLLVLHGDKDRVIPADFGRRIFELAREPKRLLIVPGAGHVECMQVENGKYRPELLRFLKDPKIP